VERPSDGPSRSLPFPAVTPRGRHLVPREVFAECARCACPTGLDGRVDDAEVRDASETRAIPSPAKHSTPRSPRPARDHHQPAASPDPL